MITVGRNGGWTEERTKSDLNKDTKRHLVLIKTFNQETQFWGVLITACILYSKNIHYLNT